MLKLNIAAAIILLALYTAPVVAQTANNFPAPISAAFTAKYPDAQVKKWGFQDNHSIQGDAAHARVFTDNKVFNINSGGQLVAVQNSRSPLLF